MWEWLLWTSAFGFGCICSDSPLCYHVWVCRLWRTLRDASGKSNMLFLFVYTEQNSEYKWCISCLDLICWLLPILVHQRVVFHEGEMEQGIVISVSTEVVKLHKKWSGAFNFGGKCVCFSVIVIICMEAKCFPDGWLPYDVTCWLCEHIFMFLAAVGP